MDTNIFPQEEEQKPQNGHRENFPPDLVRLAMDEKSEGRNDEDLKAAMLELGWEENLVNDLFEQLENLAAEKLERSNHSLLVALFMVLAGIGINLVSPYRLQLTLTDILAYCAIIAGFLKGIHAWYNIHKYKSVLKQLDAGGSSS